MSEQAHNEHSKDELRQRRIDHLTTDDLLEAEADLDEEDGGEVRA